MTSTLWPPDPVPHYTRPRAGCKDDCGDIAGLPYVVSCKNCKSLSLSEWVGALDRMTGAAKCETGIVVVKRRGRGNPKDWYVLTTLGMFLPFHDAYLMAELSA